jgi:pimeloyl-ACP methyl ester carboxylesterase
MDNVNLHKLPGAPDWRSVDWGLHTQTLLLDHAVGGTQVSYVDIGSGPVVLLVHGLGGSWRVWLENIPDLAQTHRVIAVDLPGFGDSPYDGGEATFASYAHLLEVLLQALDVDHAVAIGNSFGGWICAELTRRNPALVSGLVLIDAAGIPGTPAERRKVAGMLRMADRLTPMSIRNRDRFANSPKLRRRAFAFLVSRADLIPDDLAIYLVPERPSPIFRKVLEAAIKSWSEAWCRQLTELDTPTLILWGSLDRQLPLRHADEWHRLLRNSTLALIDGAGHMPMLEHPAEVNAHVRQFLAAQGKALAS